MHSNVNSTFPKTAHVVICNEKPSVSREFARALGVQEKEKHDGYIEGYSKFFGGTVCITWCVGHLVTMSYPEKYDEKYKNWNLEDLPFIPAEYKYEVIEDVQKQFKIVKKILVSASKIYYAGDAGREGLYIQMLVRQTAGHNKNAEERVVWIDSQTEDEIKRGIREAKPLEAYSGLKDAGYMRAIEDYSPGINFTRILSIKYGEMLNRAADTEKYRPVSVGRVMTCVLGMIVSREREIENFVTTPFYRISNQIEHNGIVIEGEWRTTENSSVFQSPKLYSEIGFKEQQDAETFMQKLPGQIKIIDIKREKERKNAPLLFNLAELQSECAKKFKISPDETLEVAQSLYEKKMLTYPRTDARVLSTAVAKEIGRNIRGLSKYPLFEEWCTNIIENKWYVNFQNTKYTDDTKVTDHYALIPTGQETSRIESLNELERNIYELVVKRFLSVFYPPAEYIKINIEEAADAERFYATGKILNNPGYLEVAGIPEEDVAKKDSLAAMEKIEKGSTYNTKYVIKKGETAPPKRYTSGSMVLAMENAGQLIEDEELRAQIKGSGIGTSATRAETIKKLVRLEYILLNKKTQVLKPAPLGNMVYEVVAKTIPSLLSPKMTASWEKGLEGIVNGQVTMEEYNKILEDYVRKECENMKTQDVSEEIEKSIRRYAIGGEIFKPEILKVPCPKCGSNLVTTKYGCTCEKYDKEGNGCSFRIGTILGVTLDKYQLERLLITKETAVIKGFKTKEGKKFDAMLSMDGNNEIKFKFPEYKDLCLKDVYCPLCKRKIKIIPGGYVCSANEKNNPNSCRFYIGKVAGKSLTENQVIQLIKNGRIENVKGLTSKAGKKFEADLILDKNAKVSISFPEASNEVSNINCPKCSDKLTKGLWAYECKCGYKISHTIAKRKLTELEVMQLMAGRTKKLDGFKGKTGKKFAAVLYLDQEGNVKFDFGG